MIDYLTDTWSLMRAVKTNLQDYRGYTPEVIQIDKKQVNFGLGFVQPKTAFPVITIFPRAKIFGPRRGGGRSIVEYQLSVDIYSPQMPDLVAAKEWAMKAAEDVKRCLKQNQHMQDHSGVKHCFKVTVTGVQQTEHPDDRGRNFQSTAQIAVSCYAYHDWAGTADQGFRQLETDSNDFMDRVIKLVKENAQGMDRVRDWVTKVGKPLTQTPAILILPADEYYSEEEFAGKTDLLVRPIVFTVVSRAFPRAATLQENIKLGDKLVEAIERAYKVDGYARQAVVSDIVYDWGVQNESFQFMSSISATYDCYQTASRIL